MSRMFSRVFLVMALLPALMSISSSRAWSASDCADLDCAGLDCAGLDCAGLGCVDLGGCSEATYHGAFFRTCSGFIGGADFVIIKPITGNLESISLTAHQNAINLSHEFQDNNYNLSPRFWLGYVNSCGLGIRLRYWNYDHELESEALNFNVIDVFSMTNHGGLEVRAIDIEVTQQITLGLWSANVAAGLRVGRVSHDSNVNIDFLDTTILNLSSRDTFEGVGPTLAGELRRGLGRSNFNFVVSGRGSLLYGTSTKSFGCNIPLDFDDLRNRGVEASSLPTDGISIKRDQLISVAELQLGLEWTRCLKSGATVFVEGLFEGQVWANTGGNHLTMTKSSDLGMVGFVFGAGISR